MARPDQRQIRSQSTRQRLLDAAEALFIEHGYEAMLVRDVTRLAGANTASVNYHFGGKEGLARELLTPRLDQLNRDRIGLLTRCERQQGGRALDAATVLSVLFVPAFRHSQPPVGKTLTLRLLGRVYSDTSPFVRDYLRDHYRPIFKRFFTAFARALPALPTDQLRMRLRLSLQGVAGLVAAEGMDALSATISMGKPVDDSVLLARVLSLVLPLLTAPDRDQQQAAVVARVLGQVAEMEGEVAVSG